MGETEISWTHRPGTVGRSWNPIQGCARVSEGCRNCYAERIAARFAEHGWSQGLINLKTKKWNGVARLAKHKLAEPLRWKKPATVFTNSMSDLFYEGFTNEQIAAVFGVMAAARQHTFQILTKRAKRMREWFEWAGQLNLDVLQHSASAVIWHDDRSQNVRVPRGTTWPLPNVWIGCSVENQDAADERIPELLATPATVRFLSCEPLLGQVDLLAGCIEERANGTTALGWVITGCESGHSARPCSVEWLRSLRDQCQEAGVPFFLKQAVCAREPIDAVVVGDGSKRKGGGVIELPYLDGVQWAQFPEQMKAGSHDAR